MSVAFLVALTAIATLAAILGLAPIGQGFGDLLQPL
jgi:hypothetical protein